MSMTPDQLPPWLRQQYDQLSSRGAMPNTMVPSGGYAPGDAPGFGTSNNPDTAGFNLFGDAREWLKANPQIWGPYGGQLSAGMSPWMAQGAQAAGQVAGYTPQTVTSGSFLTGDLGAYMNPFTQNVIDLSMQDIARQNQIANQQGARSAGASTYGGSRNALIEAETNRAYADTAARTSAQLRSQGFDTAAGLMGQDMNRSLQAGLANQQAGLMGAGLGLDAANALGRFGQYDQAQQQAGLDRQYQEYLRTTFGPMQGYNFLAGLMPGYTGGTNRGAGFAGGALSGAAIGSAFGPWGAGIGALGGGLLGLF